MLAGPPRDAAGVQALDADRARPGGELAAVHPRVRAVAGRPHPPGRRRATTRCSSSPGWWPWRWSRPRSPTTPRRSSRPASTATSTTSSGAHAPVADDARATWSAAWCGRWRSAPRCGVRDPARRASPCASRSRWPPRSRWCSCCSARSARWSACYAETWDHTTFIANIVILPLAFVGGTFYTRRPAPLAWEELSHFNPIFYLVARCATASSATPT